MVKKERKKERKKHIIPYGRLMWISVTSAKP